MAANAVRITKKGQVTIPKEIRKRLKATAVYFEVVNDDVLVRAVKDAAGALAEYAGNAKRGVSVKEIKERAWREAVHEKAGKKPA